jgi:hypothetical protein
MKGDFSRWTFDPYKNYARVLMQQGRPLVDADWNEQMTILLHRMHMLGRDLFGPHGGPADECGFGIEGVKGLPHDFEIGAGRYYVNGICCENHQPVRFSRQPIPVTDAAIEDGKRYLVYLDVWEDFVSAADDPDLLDPALGGIDTTARTRVVWQVRTHVVAPTIERERLFADWPALIHNWQPPNRGFMRVRLSDGLDPQRPRPNLVGAGQRFRGPENQLYRVEVHYGGTASSGQDGATFKWSRENGSVVLPLRGIKDNVMTLGGLEGDSWSSLSQGDWLEVIYGTRHPATQRQPLLEVHSRGPERNQVRVNLKEPILELGGDRRVLLRRWDQRPRRAARGGSLMRDGTVPIREGDGDANWIPLEDGLEIQFQPGGSVFRPGDHWLIPARTLNDGSLLWPRDGDSPAALPPTGTLHSYAPLALVEFTPTAQLKHSCRWQIRMERRAI